VGADLKSPCKGLVAVNALSLRFAHDPVSGSGWLTGAQRATQRATRRFAGAGTWQPPTGISDRGAIAERARA